MASSRRARKGQRTLEVAVGIRSASSLDLGTIHFPVKFDRVRELTLFEKVAKVV
jgi:hypothetical protein